MRLGLKCGQAEKGELKKKRFSERLWTFSVVKHKPNATY